MSICEKLESYVNKKDIMSSFDAISKYIDDMESDSKEKIIKALICDLDGKREKSNFYSIAAIMYTLFVGTLSLISDSLEGILIPVIILLVALVLGFFALRKLSSDYKAAFALRVLNFKLEELHTKKSSEE